VGTEVFEVRWNARLHDRAVLALELGSDETGKDLPEGLGFDMPGLDRYVFTSLRIGEGYLPLAIDAEDAIGKLQEKGREPFIAYVFLPSWMASPVGRQVNRNGVQIRHVIYRYSIISRPKRRLFWRTRDPRPSTEAQLRSR